MGRDWGRERPKQTAWPLLGRHAWAAAWPDPRTRRWLQFLADRFAGARAGWHAWTSSWLLRQVEPVRPWVRRLLAWRHRRSSARCWTWSDWTQPAGRPTLPSVWKAPHVRPIRDVAQASARCSFPISPGGPGRAPAGLL